VQDDTDYRLFPTEFPERGLNYMYHAAPVSLDVIKEIFDSYKEPKFLFNGATIVYLGTESFNAIVPLIHDFDKSNISLVSSTYMEVRSGLGYRKTIASDPKELVTSIGTLVWVLHK
jgi:hypothetical protein